MKVILVQTLRSDLLCRSPISEAHESPDDILVTDREVEARVRYSYEENDYSGTTELLPSPCYYFVPPLYGDSRGRQEKEKEIRSWTALTS